MNNTIEKINQDSLSFEIKYGLLDYISAINFKTKKIISVLKSKNQTFVIFVFLVFKPFIILIISLIAYVTKLKYRYHFHITQESFIRSHGEISQEVEWSRFSSYEQTDKFIFLQLDKNKGKNDGQALILKRVLKQEEIDSIIHILKNNNIHENGIDIDLEGIFDD